MGYEESEEVRLVLLLCMLFQSLFYVLMLAIILVEIFVSINALECI